MHTKTGQRLDDRAHRRRIALFVEMHPAGQHHDGLAAEITGHQFARMAGNATGGKPGKIGIGHTDRIADFLHQRPQARAEDDGDARHQTVQALHQNIDQTIRHQGSSVLKTEGKSSSMVMTFWTPVSSQR
ncbi:hypothetical protein D3C80_1254090 [compost metagenome]